VQSEQKPTYVEIKTQENIVSSGDSDRAYFGSIPDYADEVEGVAFSGVSPGSPAQKAGVKAGDVLIQFGESKVSGIEDFQNVLTKYKPGDKVKIKVKREGKDVELEVTLSKRGG
jgi:S1-C subfamily serine protease